MTNQPKNKTNTEQIQRLEKKLAKADALAEQKSNFLATISHEIRTPMQSIYGLLELIEEEKPSANISSMVTTARDSANGLLEILDDILDFAKMDADQMEMDNFEVPLRTLVRGINEALSVKIQNKDLLLKDDIEEDVPFVVQGDPKRLRQIIMNLCGNAIKFTKDGHVTIRITTDTQHITPDDGLVGLRFEIIDTGIGMDKETTKRLFTPFTQADSSTSRKYGGTGLGLSICKKLVEIMGGKIGVLSEENKGSIFWFEIAAKEVDTNAQSMDMPDLHGLSILSVEDHPQGAKEIMRSLQSMGAHVESCGTYAEALELIIRRPFDVAIVDQGLPDGVGLDLIKEIIQIRPFTGLMMYTVRDDAGLQHTLQSLGVAYLTKPASRIGLGEEVKNAANKVEKISIDGTKKLLIAEDTKSVQDVLKRQLKKIGVDADFVGDGKQALEALATGAYGILITDLHMPEMDGYEVINHVRAEDKKQNRHFPAVVLTADIQMNQRQVYMKHGFDECLLKPVSLGQLQRLLMRWGLVSENKLSTASVQAENETTDSAIHINKIIEQMGALDDSTIEMLGMFTSYTAPQIENIQEAYAAMDYALLIELGHSLKGAARSACAVELGELAAALQHQAEQSNIEENLVQKITLEFDRVEKEIKALKAD